MVPFSRPFTCFPAKVLHSFHVKAAGGGGGIVPGCLFYRELASLSEQTVDMPRGRS